MVIRAKNNKICLEPVEHNKRWERFSIGYFLWPEWILLAYRKRKTVLGPSLERLSRSSFFLPVVCSCISRWTDFISFLSFLATVTCILFWLELFVYLSRRVLVASLFFVFVSSDSAYETCYLYRKFWKYRYGASIFVDHLRCWKLERVVCITNDCVVVTHSITWCKFLLSCSSSEKKKN